MHPSTDVELSWDSSRVSSPILFRHAFFAGVYFEGKIDCEFTTLSVSSSPCIVRLGLGEGRQRDRNRASASTADPCIAQRCYL